MKRRFLLLAAALPRTAGARADSGRWEKWEGAYAGAVRFHRSIPLEDIYPPAARPRIDHDDRAPIAVQFTIDLDEAAPAIWLRIDGGPMETAAQGEALRFGPLDRGVALLASADSHPRPRSASLTLGSDLLGTEALFAHADGSFWRRHFTARFTPGGAELILWVFDAAGTRARTWRGSAVKR